LSFFDRTISVRFFYFRRFITITCFWGGNLSNPVENNLKLGQKLCVTMRKQPLKSGCLSVSFLSEEDKLAVF
jgi:hypothetical protein